MQITCKKKTKRRSYVIDIGISIRWQPYKQKDAKLITLGMPFVLQYYASED